MNHRPETDANGDRSKGWIKRASAAIEAGLEDRLWESEEAATDNATGSSSAPHGIYHNLIQHSAKVHKGSCCNCDRRTGRKGTGA